MIDCDLDAMANVGIAYKNGWGVEKDDDQASYYLLNAFYLSMELENDPDLIPILSMKEYK